MQKRKKIAHNNKYKLNLIGKVVRTHTVQNHFKIQFPKRQRVSSLLQNNSIYRIRPQMAQIKTDKVRTVIQIPPHLQNDN